MANLPRFVPATPSAPLADEVASTEAMRGEHLDRAVELDREINRLTALRARELHAHVVDEQRILAENGRRVSDLDGRSIRAEIAAALTITERAATFLADCSQVLVDQLPDTLTLLETGAISYRHALVVVDETATLDDDDRAELEAKVLSTAPSTTPSAFRRKVRVARERLHPESIEQRHTAANDTRGVTLDDIGDGMSTITATLPSPAAHAIFARITDAARGMATQDDLRTLDQRRADLLTVVLLTSEGGAPFGVIPGEDASEDFVKWFRGITAQIFITVPVLTLLGTSNEPAMLDGVVPIDPVTARLLVGNAKSFTRVLTHPETGAVLSVGRDRYKIPKDLRRYLLIRDLTCRFPGCYQPASRCDLDHTIEWQFDGESAHINLAFLCRGHHLVKGETEWGVEQESDGSGILTWMSPNGKLYRTYPGTELAS